MDVRILINNNEKATLVKHRRITLPVYPRYTHAPVSVSIWTRTVQPVATQDAPIGV